MNHAQHSTIASFIWNIADDVLRNVYVRGKYRDVILPMTVKALYTAFTFKNEAAEPVVKRKTTEGIEYEPDADLRDTEQVPLLEPGGIEAFFRREVLPYTPDAWIKEDATRIGYEVSFTRHFYQPQPLRTLEEISADILAIEKEAEGLLDGLLKVGQR